MKTILTHPLTFGCWSWQSLVHNYVLVSCSTHLLPERPLGCLELLGWRSPGALSFITACFSVSETNRWIFDFTWLPDVRLVFHGLLLTALYLNRAQLNWFSVRDFVNSTVQFSSKSAGRALGNTFLPASYLKSTLAHMSSASPASNLQIIGWWRRNSSGYLNNFSLLGSLLSFASSPSFSSTKVIISQPVLSETCKKALTARHCLSRSEERLLRAAAHKRQSSRKKRCRCCSAPSHTFIHVWEQS